jgi:hypothetical protein
MMIDENPFNQGFGAPPGAAALELDVEPSSSVRPPPGRRTRESGRPRASDASELAAEPERVQTPEQQRAARLREIAGFGLAPAKVTGAPLYWVRVVLRKRVLAEQLATLSAQRKRGDDGAAEALQKLGEALDALRDDPRLAALARQLAAVRDAESQVGQVEAQGHKRKQATARELTRLDRELARVEQAAAPLRQRETEIDGQLDQLRAQTRRAEMLRRKVDAELEALQKQKTGADPERLTALRAEHEARLGQVQTLGIQMRPLEDDLAAVRRDLALHMRTLAGLQDDKQVAITSLERSEQTQRVSHGSARGARAAALMALAQAALKQGLGELAPECAQAVAESADRAEQRRRQEELHRAALESYDHGAYGRGMMMMLGGSLLFFLSLAGMILF